MSDAIFPDRIYELIPPFLQEFTGAVPDRNRRDMLLGASVAVASALYPNTEFMYDSDWHSPHLYLVTTGNAGIGKSIQTKAFSLAEATDEYLFSQSKEARKEWYQTQNDRSDGESPNLSKKELDKLSASTGDSGAIQGESPTSPTSPGYKPEIFGLKSGDDTTSAAFVKDLSIREHGMLVASTELDTMSKANSSDFGHFDHYLRKAYHHEEIIVSRAGADPIRIKHPRVALAMHGTPRQLVRFIANGLEDGLYSRLCILPVEGHGVWRSPRPKANSQSIGDMAQSWSEHHVDVWKALAARERRLRVELKPAHWDRLDIEFSHLRDKVESFDNGVFISIVHRAALNAVRIAATLSLIRVGNTDLGTYTGADRIVVTDQDFEAGWRMAREYAIHSMNAALQVDPEVRKAADTYTMEQMDLLRALPREFTTTDIKDAAEHMGVPRSTMYDWIGKWSNGLGVIEHVKRGQYRKTGITPSGGLDFLN